MADADDIVIEALLDEVLDESIRWTRSTKRCHSFGELATTAPIGSVPSRHGLPRSIRNGSAERRASSVPPDAIAATNRVRSSC
jgi:hypothetical protein